MSFPQSGGAHIELDSGLGDEEEMSKKRNSWHKIYPESKLAILCPQNKISFFDILYIDVYGFGIRWVFVVLGAVQFTIYQVPPRTLK